MCGITGFCDFTQLSTPEILASMTDTMLHRGPDGRGNWTMDAEKYSIGLGHRRLSIIDLSTLGAQPMHFEHLHLVLNGEVYNYREIKSELLELGYTFTSGTDTEVVLKAFHRWGIACVDRFIGMFAIALYDEHSKEVILIRDRAGVKPVYYSWHNDILLFGSELRALIKHPKCIKRLNNRAVSAYFQLGYIPAPHSIYQHIYKLEPGHYLRFNIEKKELRTVCYWNVVSFYNKPKLNLHEDEIVSHTHELLKSAFNYRMVSDVPVGVFLSGGYDSATVAAILQATQPNRINTFTIGFEDPKYNEAPFAKTIAQHLGTHHSEYYCTPSDVKGILPLLGHMFDEPFGDSSAVPTYLVSKMARQHVTVALSADAGDEVFGGYTRYQTIMDQHNRFNRAHPLIKAGYMGLAKSALASGVSGKINKYNIETRIRKVIEIMQASSIGQSAFSTTVINTSNEAQQLLRTFEQTSPDGYSADQKLGSHNHQLDALMTIDFQSYMVDDILVKVDRAAMAVSLEGREPLLDHRIIEFMSQIPNDYKIRNGDKKYILKKIAHQYLPKSMMDRPKRGFSFPVFEWLKADMKEVINQLLNQKYIEHQGIFNWKEVNKLTQQYLSGKPINAQKIWVLLSFQLWYKEWVD